MAINKSDIHQQAKLALAAIKAAYNAEDDDSDVTLYVAHHLAEVDASYWNNRFQTNQPAPSQILDALILCSDIEEIDNLDSLDFTLPGRVTDYLLCVTFNEDGEVEDIAMES